MVLSVIQCTLTTTGRNNAKTKLKLAKIAHHKIFQSSKTDQHPIFFVNPKNPQNFIWDTQGW